jgi:hypothetical protein
LSETLNLGATNVLEAEFNDNASYNSVGENIDFDTLTPLIEANANVLVRCPWLDNELVTLSTASIAYSDRVALITHENINVVASVMQELLANPVIQTEVFDEHSQPADKDEQDNTFVQIDEVNQVINTETVEQVIHHDLSGNNDEKPMNIDAEVAAPLGEIANEVIEISDTVDNTSTSAETVTLLKSVKQKSEHAAQDTSKVKVSISSTKTSPSTFTKEIHSVPEVSIETNRQTIIPAREVVTDVSDTRTKHLKTKAEVHINDPNLAEKPDVVVEKKTVIFKASEIPTATKPIVEAETDPGRPRVTDIQVAPSNTLPVSLEATAEPAPLETLPQESEGEVTLENTVEQTEDIVAVAGHDPVLVEIDDPLDASSPSGFAEDEDPLDYFYKTDIEPSEHFLILDSVADVDKAAEEESGENSVLLIYQTEEEPNNIQQTEVFIPEQPVWVNLKSEEVEEVLYKLVEYLDDGEPEEVEAVNIILDKIIELPTKVEIQNEEDIITENKVEEELTELLSEVLDRMDIDYTPETFDSLVQLIIGRNISKVIKPLNDEEKDEAPYDTGTHEVISQLLLGLSTIKKSLEHASAIGRSALLLSNT